MNKQRTTKERRYRVTLTTEVEVDAMNEDEALNQAKEMHGGYLDIVAESIEELRAYDWPAWVPEHMREPMVRAAFTDHRPNLMMVKRQLGRWWMTNGHVALIGEGPEPDCTEDVRGEWVIPAERIAAEWVDAEYEGRRVKLHVGKVMVDERYHALVESCFPGCSWEIYLGPHVETEAVYVMRNGELVAIVMPMRGIAHVVQTAAPAAAGAAE